MTVYDDIMNRLPRVTIKHGSVRIAIPGFGPESDYVFDLDRCDTHEKLLCWCYHLGKKTWVTSDLMCELIEVVCRHHGWSWYGI